MSVNRVLPQLRITLYLIILSHQAVMILSLYHSISNTIGFTQRLFALNHKIAAELHDAAFFWPLSLHKIASIIDHTSASASLLQMLKMLLQRTVIAPRAHFCQPRFDAPMPLPAGDAETQADPT